MSDVNVNEQVSFWLDRLKHADTDAAKAAAASELTDLARVGGVVRTRGTLTRAAPSALPESSGGLGTILEALSSNNPPEVRRQVVHAVGAWGDDLAARILAQLAAGPEADPDEGVRRAAVSALGVIGGPDAVRALRSAAMKDVSEAVRYDAISALAQLAITADPLPRPPRGAVRTRGSAPQPRADLSPAAREVLETLIEIRDNQHEKEYLRRMAEGVAEQLQD